MTRAERRRAERLSRKIRPANLAVLPAAVLLAGAFPIVAGARELDPPARAAEAPRADAAPPPAREESAAPPDGEPRRFEVEPVTVEAERRSGFVAGRQSSATKLPLSLRETPQGVSVITRESLEARQVQDFGQALETAAAVTQFSGPGPYAGRSAWGFNETAIRGIALNGASDIREDGFLSSSYFATPDLAVYDRIEIVKGPSALYGRGAAGGFVNRIRKTPLSEAQAEVRGSFGSFDLYRVDADVTGPMIPSGTVRGRFVAAYEDSGSFVDDVESERAVVAPGVEVDVTETTVFRATGVYQDDTFVSNNGFPLRADGSTFRAPRIPRSRFIGIPNRKDLDWEFLSGTAEIEQKLGDDWLAMLRLNASSIDTPNRLDGYAYGVLSPEGDTSLLSSEYVMDRDMWTGELRVAGALDVLGRTLNLGAGVDRSDLDYSRRGAYAFIDTVNVYTTDFDELAPPAELNPAEDSRTDAEDVGVYFQAEIRPIDRVSVLVGGRHEWTDTRRRDLLNGGVTEDEVAKFTGRAGLVVDLAASISAYALWAESFEPSLFSVARDGSILEPEEGEIWEVGVKSAWLDERLTATAAIFRIDRENVAISDPENGPGEFFSVASGLQRSDGVELEVNGELLPGWVLSFAGALLDSEFEKRADPFFGTKPGGAADWQVGFFTSYELQRGLLRGLGGGVGVFAIDERGVSTFQAGAVPGYERVDLTLFYRGLEPFRAALQVRNVFDARYVEGVDRPGSYAQWGSPTAVLFQIEGRFDETSLRRLGALVRAPDADAARRLAGRSSDEATS